MLRPAAGQEAKSSLITRWSEGLETAQGRPVQANAEKRQILISQEPPALWHRATSCPAVSWSRDSKGPEEDSGTTLICLPVQLTFMSSGCVTVPATGCVFQSLPGSYVEALAPAVMGVGGGALGGQGRGIVKLR